MRRRHYLALSGAVCVGLAGCSAVTDAPGTNESEDGNTSGQNTDTPEQNQYQDSDKESMLPDSVGSDWPDQDLEPDHDRNDNFERVWISSDDDTIVLMDVEIHQSVASTERQFERAKATPSDPRDYPLADDAFIADDGQKAYVVFRESNASGETTVAVLIGGEIRPDRTRAARYAELLYQEWP